MSKGGSEHREAQRLICDHYRRRGKIAIIEGFAMNMRAVDVLVQDPVTKRTEAVEYETGRNLRQALRNIYFNLQAFDKVTVVSSQQSVLDRIIARGEHIFGSELNQKVRFRLLKGFVPQTTKKTTILMPE